MNTKLTEETRDLLAAIVKALDLPVTVYDDQVRDLRNAAADVRGVLAGVLEDGATPQCAAEVLRQATAVTVPTETAVLL